MVLLSWMTAHSSWQKVLNEFKTEAIDKLMDLYHDDLEGLMDRFDAIIDAGRGYEFLHRSDR